MPSRIIRAACAALAASLVAAAPAVAAPSVSVQAPASASPNTQVSVVYSGMADTGVEDSSMILVVFYERSAPSCATTAAEQRARANSRFDAQQYVAAPAPFTFTSTLRFPDPGTYRFCAYLEIGSADTAPPAAFSAAVLQVGPAPIPCKVPQLSGLSLAAATKKLRTAGCSVGKVAAPKKAGKKKLVVKSQSRPGGLRLDPGAKVNLVLTVKKAKK